MFAQLPRLFDRNFAIGYFLPITVFVVASYGILTGFGLASDPYRVLTENNALVSTSIVLIASWFLAVLLLALNRTLYMLKEGYLVPSWIRNRWQGDKRRYTRLRSRLGNLTKEIERQQLKASSDESVFLEKLRAEEEEVALKLAEEFPAEEFPGQDVVLPTRFGNAIRSFETYPNLVYKLDDIPGWSRLLTVIPKDYRDLIDGAKAQVDFWLNLWVVCWLLILEYIGVVIGLSALGGSQQNLTGLIWSWTILYLLVSIAAAVFASWQSRHATIIWGDYVMASYDVFLPDLAKKLGFPPATRQEHQELWRLFSRVIIYRDPEHIGKLLWRLSEPPVEESSTGIDNLATAHSLPREHAANQFKTVEPESPSAANTQRESTLLAEIEQLKSDQVLEHNERLRLRETVQHLESKLRTQQDEGLKGRLRRLLSRSK